MIGIGTDIQSIPEFERAKDLQQPGFFFTDEECRHGHRAAAGAAASLTGILAAKEALFKSLPTRIKFFWTDAEVRHSDTGAPHFCFYGTLNDFMTEQGLRTLLSISHSGDYASAFVVVDR